jgi:tight adherence protein C
MGEKAGTKLLIPLFLLLAVVMAMITVPAWIAFG